MTSRRRGRDHVLMDVAYAWSTRSTCTRTKVGAVIAIDSRTISSGYNGVPAGMAHCDHACGCQAGWVPETASLTELVTTHAAGCPLNPCTVTVHAEANAIAFAARYGVATRGATIYTTVAPCYECAKLIVNAGLIRCVYGKPYRLYAGIELLTTAGLVVSELP